jgi:hypothetical protein
MNKALEAAKPKEKAPAPAPAADKKAQKTDAKAQAKK